MKIVKQLSATLTFSLLLAGCADTPRSESNIEDVLVDMEMAEDRRVDSIRDYRIDGWRYVDRYHVILTAGQNENYLVSFMTPCTGLNGAMSIGFTSTTGGVTEFDDIVVEGPGRMVEVCAIKEIVRLKDSD